MWLRLMDVCSVLTVTTQILCLGQTPNSEVLSKLSPKSIDEQGFIGTRKTLQITDDAFSNIFAVGDVATTGAHKAARP